MSDSSCAKLDADESEQTKNKSAKTNTEYSMKDIEKKK